MIVALVMLWVIICTAFVSSYLVNSAIDSTCEALENCIQKEENDKAYSLRIKEAISVWERSKKLVYPVMFSEAFSVVEENMIRLEFLSENYDFSGISHLCAETELLLKNKKEESKIDFQNVF